MTNQELPALPTKEETQAFIAKLHAWAATLSPKEELAPRVLAAAAASASAEEDAEVQGYGWLSIAVGGVLGGPGGALTAAVLSGDAQDTANAAWQGYWNFAGSVGRQIVSTTRVSRL